MIQKEINELVGKKLRKLRLEKDKKEDELCKLLQCDISTYSRYENGRISLPKEKAQTLANYYQINLEEIYPNNDNVYISDSFHNSPSSGNINSTIVPQEFITTITKMLAKHEEQNASLLKMTLENQKIILELLNKNQG